MKPLTLILFCLLSVNVRAQSFSPLPVPVFPGLFADAFSVVDNPALLAGLKQFTAGVYAGNRFMLADLKHAVLSAGLPFGRAGLGAHINYVNAGAFTQTEFGLAYAKVLGAVDIGARFNYDMIAVQGYGSNGSIGADVGAVWHVADNFHVGVNLNNPAGGKIAYVYSLGLGYEVSSQLKLSTIIKKEENKPPDFILAMHYEPAARVLLQAGIATATAEPFFGIGYQLDKLRLLCTVGYHPQLGLSPAISLMYKSTRP